MSDAKISEYNRRFIARCPKCSYRIDQTSRVCQSCGQGHIFARKIAGFPLIFFGCDRCGVAAINANECPKSGCAAHIGNDLFKLQRTHLQNVALILGAVLVVFAVGRFFVR